MQRGECQIGAFEVGARQVRIGQELVPEAGTGQVGPAEVRFFQHLRQGHDACQFSARTVDRATSVLQ